MNLEELTKRFRKHLKLDDTKLMMLHTALATKLSVQMRGTPLWIIYVGPSGDVKSELIISLDDKKDTYMLHEITSNALVSGFTKYKKVKKEWVEINCDLAPQLDGKLVLIPDMAAILKLHPNEKAKVWAQLRELYDGRAGKKTGNMEKKKSYENLRISLLACSTPAIDSQILIHQDLGTRELIYRTDIGSQKEKDVEGEPSLTDKVWENEEHEEVMRTDLNSSVKGFLKDKKIKNIIISNEVKKELEIYVEVLRHLRASAEVDSFSGELIGVVYPEQPTRVLKQLKRLFIALKSLDDKYPDDLALQIIRHVVKSSCSYNRWLVLAELAKMDREVSVSKIGQELKLGTKTIYRELNILWNLGLIDRIVQMKDYYGKTIEIQYWKRKDNELSKKIKEIFILPHDTPDNKRDIYFSIRTFFILKKEKKINNSNIPSCKEVYHYTLNNNSSKEKTKLHDTLDISIEKEEELTDKEKEILEDFEK